MEPLVTGENLDFCETEMLGMVADLKELQAKLDRVASELGQLRHKHLLLMESQEIGKPTQAILQEVWRLQAKLKAHEEVVPRCPSCGGSVRPVISLTTGKYILACNRKACAWTSEQMGKGLI